MHVLKGQFYEFERSRNVARAGQPIFSVEGFEIGLVIAEEMALRRVRAGRDVYTLRDSDAFRLASKIQPGTRASERHLPKGETQSGRTDVYFRHYHPGNNRIFGHIFFGGRGEGVASTIF